MGRPAITAKDIVLKLLGSDGRIVVPGKAPNMAVLFSPLIKAQYTKPQLTRAVYRLRKLNLLKVRREEGNTVITLTEAGRQQALRYALDTIELEKPFRWQGNWHVVLFDIPNQYRVARNALRERLRRMGLAPLQESIWITPYACGQEVRFIAQMLNIGPFVKTMVVSQLDPQDTAKMKEKFGVR